VRHKRYYYRLMGRYLNYYLPDGAYVVDVMPRSRLLHQTLGREVDTADDDAAIDRLAEAPPDRIIMNGCLHIVDDVQALFDRVRRGCSPDTRIVVTYFSSLWKPLFRLAARAGWADVGGDRNWLATNDVRNLLALSGFEVVAHNERVLLPVWIPLVSALVNRWLAPLPGFRLFALANVLVARPVASPLGRDRGLSAAAWAKADAASPPPVPPSVSVVVAARNERGNIAALVKRLPAMGPDDELIFVEGHSKDGTWEEIQRVAAAEPGRRIHCLQQKGRGKGDAVRAGFAVASRDILMILDADLSVEPEILPRFYRAIAGGTGEFINGSRLVYPMEAQAMRFANLLGNKFFAAAFSFLLGQPLKDTLCGTKVLHRRAYEAIARNRSYFGEFDPFGDFDLLFGASRMALKIVELPVHYRQRTYGETNIQRWAHGWLLLRMTAFAARRLKFL
jgi:hypothetical protein